MKIDNKNIQSLFIDYFREKYKDDPTLSKISDSALQNMLQKYFLSVRYYIESDDLNHVRLKYFGLFKPLYGKMQYFFKKADLSVYSKKDRLRYEKLEKLSKERLETIKK